MPLLRVPLQHPREASTLAAADLKGADKPSILFPDSVRVHDIGGGEARILVGAEQSGGAWWLGNFRNDPGRVTSLHVHHSADEQFSALEGVVSVWVDGCGTTYPRGRLQWCRAGHRTRWGTAPNRRC